MCPGDGFSGHRHRDGVVWHRLRARCAHSPPQILCEPVAVAAATTWAQLVAAFFQGVKGLYMYLVLQGGPCTVDRRKVDLYRYSTCIMYGDKRYGKMYGGH